MRKLAVLLLLFVFTSLFAAAQKKTDPAPDAILSKAAELTDLSHIGPLKLTANVRLLGMANGPLEAKFRLYWKSSKEWRSEWQFEKWFQLYLRVEGKRWKQTNLPKPVFRFLQFENAVKEVWNWTGDANSTTNRTSDDKYRFRSRKLEGISNFCIGNSGHFERWRCFFEDSYLPHQFETDADVFGTYTFSDYEKENDSWYPRSIKVLDASGRSNIEARIELSKWSADDERDVFLPPAGATVTNIPDCPDTQIKAPWLVSGFPQRLSGAVRGTSQRVQVVYEMTIGKEGSVDDLILLQSGGTNFDKGAAEALKKFKYKPMSVCGHAVDSKAIAATVFSNEGTSNFKLDVHVISTKPGAF